MFYRSARGCIIRSSHSDATKSSFFFLCRICVLTASGECVHTADEERALTCTCEIEEVWLAVEKGYRVVEIYEFYEYQVTQYNPVTGEGRLFVN